ncbi:MAG TPA: carbon monoxide dehydrogenase subunit G [Gemmatimonadales bacterium]
MIVEGTHVFPGPREVVWSLLLDPEILAKTMPGTAAIVKVSEDRYEGSMAMGIGPITAAVFDVAIAITDRVEPEGYTMQIDGKGKFGFTRGKAVVRLAPEGPGTTMNYQADLVVGGKIAAVGQRLLDSVSKLMLRQGLDAMTRELERRLAGGGA